MAENQAITEAEARRIVGAGATTPPPTTSWESPSTSVSEGTMARGSYVPSPTRPRGYNRTAVNDDGTPIADETNRLLRQVLAELQKISAALKGR